MCHSGGVDEAWDGIDHSKDEQSVVQKDYLPGLLRLCAASGDAFKFDEHDTYEYNNDEK